LHAERLVTLSRSEQLELGTPAERDLPPTENVAETQEGLVEPPRDRNDATDEIST
jgi:hypothetical protein